MWTSFQQVTTRWRSLPPIVLSWRLVEASGGADGESARVRRGELTGDRRPRCHFGRSVTVGPIRGTLRRFNVERARQLPAVGGKRRFNPHHHTIVAGPIDDEGIATPRQPRPSERVICRVGNGRSVGGVSNRQPAWLAARRCLLEEQLGLAVRKLEAAAFRQWPEIALRSVEHHCPEKSGFGPTLATA